MLFRSGIGTYHRFKELFDRYSSEAGKEQYLIPYFIAAHPGTTDEDMLDLAVWLKTNGFRADQVQAFLPGPMATATAMWHTGRNPLRKVSRDSESVYIPKGAAQRRLHKALLRYHDANNWPLIREALKRMGRADLIGNAKHQLVPAWQPAGTGGTGAAVSGLAGSARTAARARPGQMRTQHTGLPPASTAAKRPGGSSPRGPGRGRR